jgi:glutamate dehydrogenase
MTLKTEEIEAALIDDVCSRVRERLEDDEARQVEQFVRQYYRRVPPDDLIGRSELDVYGAALAHWNFICRRMPGEAKVRVYNPQFEQHGWQSAHTVVEIVTDDMPFLVDSVSMELGRHGYGIHLLIHPIIDVRRDEGGELVELVPSGAEQPAESVIHVEIDRQSDPRELDALRGHLARVLGEVRAVVEDWPRMRERAQALIDELDEQPPPVDRSEVDEAKALLAWLEQAHFTFLGYRDYDLVTEDGEDRLRAVAGSGLGILR